MKETFTEKNFRDASLQLIATCERICNAYARQGFDLSTRQLYYQLVSKNVVPNTEKSYDRVQEMVSEARLAGLIDWNMIKDRNRETIHPPFWRSPAAILEADAQCFQIDRWEDQPNYVELMVEKQALEGVLLPVCQTLRVPFTSNKGYCSSSTMYEASKRFIDAGENGKELYIIYLGDHDPSGIDMSRDIGDRMDLFTEQAGVTVKRVALNMAQIREFRPPPNPAKITDSRAHGYINRFGRESWELDAIEPARLGALVRSEINKLIDPELWDKSGRKEDRMKAELQRMSDEYIDIDHEEDADESNE